MNGVKAYESNDPYAILGVRRGDSAAKIKKAYHKLALKYHPDKLKSNNAGSVEESAEKFKKINEAYTKVTDEMSRGASRSSSFHMHR